MLYIRIGDSYRLEKEFDKAKEEYRKVLEVDPNNKFALYGLKKIKEMEETK